MGATIFSTHPLHPEAAAGLAALAPLRVATSPTPAAILAESEGAAVIVVRAPIPAEAAGRPSLRAFVRHGAGLDMIPVAEATAAGVLVANVPGANARTVAEHAVWSALALLRRYPQVAADLRTQGWAAARAHAGLELSGRSLGIVGLGHVGTALLRIARAGFGMRVRAVTGRPDPLPEGAERASLPEALGESDVVVLCCPLTDATRGLVGAAELALMRPHAVLVNVARGPVVDEAALVAALRARRIGGAALDVFDAQPLPPDHPLLTLSNVILTPHMAGITTESMRRMGMGVVGEARAILAGERPPNLRNPEAWDRYALRFP